MSLRYRFAVFFLSAFNNQKAFRNLYVVLNILAIATHVGLAGWGFRSLVNKDNTLTIYRDVMVRRYSNETIACDDCAATDWRNQTIVLEKECTGKWDGLLIITASEVWTAFFHVLYIVEYCFFAETPVAWTKLQSHPFRWIEYSVSATLYSLANMVGIGLRNVYALAFGGVCLVCVQLLGGQAEYAIAQSVFAINRDSTASSWRYVVAFSFTVALLLQLAVFAVIGVQIGSSPDGGFTRDDGESFDGFQTQVGFYIVQYCFFPFIFAVHWWNVVNPSKERKKTSMSNDSTDQVRKLEESFKKAELRYIIAGVLTKSQMFVSIFTTVSELYSNYLEIDPPSDTDWQMIRLVTGSLSVGLFIVGFALSV
jgi:hypothetical protein